MATAAGVATVSAADLFPVDQLATNACAAASAFGFGADGRATVVDVRWDDAVVDVVGFDCVEVLVAG